MLPDTPHIHNELLDQVAAPLADWASRLRPMVENFERQVRAMDDPVAFAVRDSEPVVLRKMKMMVKACWECVHELEGTSGRVNAIRDRLDMQLRAINGLSADLSESEQLANPDTSSENEPKCTHRAPDSVN
jgi:hypothetical protein